MIQVWKPEATVGEDGTKTEALVTGVVEVDVPKYIQRLKYLKEAKFKISADGEVDSGVDNLDMMIKAIELAENHIKKVDLTVIETGEKITSVEVMVENPSCDESLTEIGFLVLNGPKLGKR